MHYRADGGLDMRFSSSKEAFASGLCDSRGFSTSSSGWGGGGSSSCSAWGGGGSSSRSGWGGGGSSSRSDMHYRKDGGLDMRFSSSKQAFASGLCDSRGFSTSSSGLGSGGSASRSDMHYRKDGGLDMRYKSSKQARDSGRCDSRGFSDELKPATPRRKREEKVDASITSNAKEMDDKYRYTGQTKHGKRKHGTEAAHILSHEVLDCVLRHTRGKMYGPQQQERIAKALNSDKNLRLKSFDGNRYGSDGYSGDRYHDQKIMNAMDATSPQGKILTNQATVDRVKRVWETTKQLDLPDGLKQDIRAQLSQLRDQDGRVIVRANARLSND